MVHFTGEKSENQVVHIDHGNSSKVIRLSWKYPSSDFQDRRGSWGESQVTEKVE